MQLFCDFFSHGMRYGMHGKTSFRKRNVPFVIYTLTGYPTHHYSQTTHVVLVRFYSRTVPEVNYSSKLKLFT